MQGTLVIVGAGRVGRAIARRCRELGWRIGPVITRSVVTARRAVRWIGAGSPHANIPRRMVACTVILVATPDAAIASTAVELARVGGEELKGKIVLHTSGALDSSELAAARDCGAQVASMHPLQSFSGVAVPPLEGKIFAIEGDPVAVRTARRIARSLGGVPVRIAPKDKTLYHVAGTLAAAQTLAIVEAAVRLLISLGMKRKEAMHALLPMTRQVLENYERLGPRAAWTGPLSRGDHAVVASHIAALQDYSPECRVVYEALNRLALGLLSRDPQQPSSSAGRRGFARGSAK